MKEAPQGFACNSGEELYKKTSYTVSLPASSSSSSSIEVVIPRFSPTELKSQTNQAKKSWNSSMHQRSNRKKTNLDHGSLKQPLLYLKRHQ
ncbi:hypothetical protein VTL71DRAFT_5250 [Oculimacula yallundae]|uniref:Uncharacterized protein n=1 Tax=Oculimacula yallundae TaxID=86028 RepID=A0ABR4C170_9HELO